MKNIQFGLVGCGHIAHRHAEHIVKHPNGNLAGVFDIVQTPLDQFTEIYKVMPYPSLEEILNSATIDIINICTPNGTHADIAISALNHGKHVLVEKPMCLTTRDAQKMVSAAAENDRKLFVVKQNRYNPPVHEVKKHIDKGHFGKIYSVDINCFWNRNTAYYKQSSWRGSKDLDGGALFTQFSHFIDILYYLFGNIDEIKGYSVNLGHKDLIEIDDTGSFSLRFENGTIGSLSYTTCAHQQNMEGSITVFGEKGTVKIGGKYLNTIDYQVTTGFEIRGIENSNEANNYGFYEGSMSNHDKVIQNVIEVLNGKAEIKTSGVEGAAVVSIIERMYQASN